MNDSQIQQPLTLQAIPTNIITGFLGAGKTSAIKHLLGQKPENERWAILVNEFGEIGIDSLFFNNTKRDSTNIYIKEVTGGCMCCTSSLGMQVALNSLLKDAKPHRLIIEPTGLGHPIEVLQTLSNKYYKHVLKIENTISLVDARNLDNNKYTQHEIFNQQLEVANIVVGNKVDLYQQHDSEALMQYLSDDKYNHDQIYFTSYGALSLEWLSGMGVKNVAQACHQQKNEKPSSSAAIQELVIPNEGYITAQNNNAGFKSIGWRFSESKIFNHEKLMDFLNNTVAIRIKGSFITTKGIYSFNKSVDTIQEEKVDHCLESRLEIIGYSIDQTWQQNVLNTLEN